MQRAPAVRVAESLASPGEEEAGSAFGTGPEILDERAEEPYSSSIWLYITRTDHGALDSAFRIGVLHLVARRATIERLDSESESASKRAVLARFLRRPSDTSKTARRPSTRL
jgi:hypothetical protein